MVGVEDDPVHEGLLPRICKDLFELSGELQAEDPSLICKVCGRAGPEIEPIAQNGVWGVIDDLQGYISPD